MSALRAPAWRQTFARWSIRIGFVFVVVMVTGSIGSGRIHPDEYGWRTPLAIIGFCVLTQQVSMLPFRILGLVFRGLAFILALPLLLLAAMVGAAFLGVGALFLFVPILPFLLVIAFVVWLVRRNRSRIATS